MKRRTQLTWALGTLVMWGLFVACPSETDTQGDTQGDSTIFADPTQPPEPPSPDDGRIEELQRLVGLLRMARFDDSAMIAHLTERLLASDELVGAKDQQIAALEGRLANADPGIDESGTPIGWVQIGPCWIARDPFDELVCTYSRTFPDR